MANSKIIGFALGSTVIAGKPGGPEIRFPYGYGVMPPEEPVGENPGAGGGNAGMGEFADMQGRITRVVVSDQPLASVTITKQPTHGRATVNDDLSISWNIPLTAPLVADSIGYTFKTQAATAVSVPGTYNATIKYSHNVGGWMKGYAPYYEVDANLLSKIEPGLNHRKVHVSPNGHTADTIAQKHGVAVTTITNAWLATTPAHADLGGNGTMRYGETPATALVTTLGVAFWRYLVPASTKNVSHHLLLDRANGHDYGNLGTILAKGVQGESAMHPLLIDSYGSGALPKTSTMIRMESANNTGAGFVVVRGLDQVGAKVDCKAWGPESPGFFLAENIRAQHAHLNPDQTKQVSYRYVGALDSYATPTTSLGLTVAGVKYPYYNESGDRMSCLFVVDCDEVLLEGMVVTGGNMAFTDAYTATFPAVDYNMFSQWFRDGTGEPLPSSPGGKGHGVYLQKQVTGVYVKGMLNFANAGSGLQARGGAVMRDNFFADSNELAFVGVS